MNASLFTDNQIAFAIAKLQELGGCRSVLELIDSCDGSPVLVDGEKFDPCNNSDDIDSVIHDFDVEFDYDYELDMYCAEVRTENKYRDFFFAESKRLERATAEVYLLVKQAEWEAMHP